MGGRCERKIRQTTTTAATLTARESVCVCCCLESETGKMGKATKKRLRWENDDSSSGGGECTGESGETQKMSEYRLNILLLCHTTSSTRNDSASNYSGKTGRHLYSREISL